MKKGYIDSNVFIQAILREDVDSRDVLRKIINNEFEGITSILSWDELVYILRKFINSESAISEGRKFLGFPNLKFIDAKKDIILRAQKLIEKYNIKPRYAIHAATALQAGVNEIVSGDADFDKISELKRIAPVNI